MTYRRLVLRCIPFLLASGLAVNGCGGDDNTAATTDAGPETGTPDTGNDSSPADASDAAVCAAGAYARALSGAGTTDDVTGVAVDADGSTWISGTFIGTTKWGTFTLSDADLVHTTGFVAKLDPSGTVLFATALHGTNAVGAGVSARRVRLDAAGNAYVAGTFFTELKLGSTVDLFQQNGFGAGAAYLVKFDKSGNPLWGLGTVNPGGTEAGFDVAVDTNGDVYFTGNYGGQVQFVTPGGDAGDGGGAPTITVAGSGNGVFLAKWSQTDQKWVWAKGWTGGGNFGGTGMGIALAADGVTVVGNIAIQIDIEGTQLGALATQEDGSFLVKTDKTDGHVLWATELSNIGTAEARLNAAVADATGNIYVTGFFQDTATLMAATSVDDAGADAATGSLQVTATGTGRDVLVAKYSADGTPLWVKHAGTGNANARGDDITLDGTGGLYLAGFKQGPAVFDSKTLSDNGNLFVAKYDTASAITWVQGNVSAGAGGGEANAIAVKPSGVTIGGNYATETTLGTINLTSTATGPEAFVARLCN